MKFSDLPLDDAFKDLPRFASQGVDLEAEHVDYYDGPSCGFATVEGHRCWFHLWDYETDAVLLVKLTPEQEAKAREVISLLPFSFTDIVNNDTGIGAAEVLGWMER